MVKQTPGSYTGYRRRTTTRLGVRVSEIVSRYLIGLGGIGTVIAVFGVCIFLVAVVLPLFRGGEAREEGTVPLLRPGRTALAMGVDEYRVMGWVLQQDGNLRVFRLDDGELLEETRIFPEGELTAFSHETGPESFALGFRDGTIRIARLRFSVAFPDPATVPARLRALEEGEIGTHEGGVVEVTPEGQLRHQSLRAEVGDPLPGEGSDSGSAAIVRIDHAPRPSGATVCFVTDEGRFWLEVVEEFENVFDGSITYDASTIELPLGAPPAPAGVDLEASGVDPRWPAAVTVSGNGRFVYSVWPWGRVQRYLVGADRKASVVEELDLFEAPGRLVTEVGMLLGGTTLLVGDSAGSIATCFPAKPEGAGTVDGVRLVRAHDFKIGPEPVESIVTSSRTRVFAAGDRGGRIRLFHVTGENLLLEVNLETGDAVELVTIAPKNDGLAALAGGALRSWDIDLRHPEASLASMFLPTWYESYPGPAHVWQSSSGDDAFEPKFGLWPLVFGTLKATIYSLIFGVPIALLAAIYTSEFLHSSIKTRVKTFIELMASLPSVVLGFLAALVFAPFVQAVVPTTLVSFLTIPGSFLLGAYLWQMLPDHFTLRFSSYRILVMALLLPVGILLAVPLGPAVERWFFLGDMKVWLYGDSGSPFGGWLMLIAPASGIGLLLLSGRLIRPWFRRVTSGLGPRLMALADLARFVAGVSVTLGFAALVSWILSGLGLDPRGENMVFGTYVQRNAMIVGFVMGFAIIPIIYTIAEDALSAVPDHLRAASLGAGATEWQTAMRIVIPTAMSGLFSAVMIGLGRAVGETMIVLMAAGNTPILELNIFNGFRTLSANIATELPEAVQGSTHYRILFLAALILFAMTFLINTVAEAVRLRFRKRAFQL